MVAIAESEKYTLVADIPDALLKTYLSRDVVAVDAELQGLQLWRDEVCLVQVCDKEGNVCLVKIKPPKLPRNLARLLTDTSTVKIFHYALSDVAFLKVSLHVDVYPYRCTKIMSKLARTYSDSHGLKDLVYEFIGVALDKQNQSSDWSKPRLSQSQLKYAASDVLYLVEVYRQLQNMIDQRGKLPSGITLKELNEKSQACLPVFVEIFQNRYGDRDRGWETSLFSH